MSYSSHSLGQFPTPDFSSALSSLQQGTSQVLSTITETAEETARQTASLVSKADKAARSTGLAPGSALGSQGIDKPYLPPPPSSQQKRLFYDNPPLAVIRYMVGAHVDFFTVLLSRLHQRTGKSFASIQVPGSPGDWEVPNVASLKGNKMFISLRPSSSDSLVSLSLKVLASLFCCASSVFFEVNRMVFVLPVGKKGMLGAAPAAAGAGAGAGAGSSQIPPAAAQKGAEGLTFWGLVKTIGPIILKQVGALLVKETQKTISPQTTGLSRNHVSQTQELYSSLSSAGALSAGSGAGKGSTSNGYLPVFIGGVAVCGILLILALRRKK